MIILFFFTFYVAAQFLAAGKVLNFYLGIPPLQGMLIGAVLVLFYTAAGGLLAVGLDRPDPGHHHADHPGGAAAGGAGGAGRPGRRCRPGWRALGGTYLPAAPGQTTAGWPSAA